MKTRINLIPPEARKKEMKWAAQLGGNLKWILLIILPVVIWKLSVAGLLTKIKSDLHKMEGEINSYTQKTSSLKLSMETDLKVKEDKLNNIKMAIREKEEELRKLGAIAEVASQKERFAYDLLKMVAESISEEVWLDELGFDREENNFYLKGFGLSHHKINLFLTKLNSSPHLRELYTKRCEAKPVKEGDKKVIRFEAEAKLNF